MSHDKIQKQGRWSGHAFEMYIHLAASVMREAVLETVDIASLTAAERRALTDHHKGRVRNFVEQGLPIITSV